MRKIKIPQQPDRPDIDDLIFGDDHETQAISKPLTDLSHAGRRMLNGIAAAWFFITILINYVFVYNYFYKK